MSAFDIELHNVSFEVRFGDGFLYLDKCGQTLLDITRVHKQWVVTDVNVQGGSLDRYDTACKIIFSSDKFNFIAPKAQTQSIEEISSEASTVWKFVKNNLGISDILRVGTRFIYLLPTKSNEHSESLLSRCKLNIDIPDDLLKNGFSVKTRNITTILQKDSYEYRINLGGVARYESVEPDALATKDPRFLSKNQREARLSQLKNLSRYKSDPMFAVQLDVDCFSELIELESVKDEILCQARIVKDFLLELVGIKGE